MELLKNKNVIMFLLASGLSFLGNGMHFIALSWLAFEMTNSPLAVGLLVAIGAIPGIIIAPFTGVFADRYNKKIIAIIMDIARGIVVLAIPFSVKEVSSSMLFLYIFTLLLTLFNNFFYPAMSGLIKECIDEKFYFKVLSINSTLQQLGFIIGPTLGGFLVSISSIEMIFYIDALTFFISGLLLSFLSYNFERRTNDNSLEPDYTIWRDFTNGLSYLKSSMTIKYLLAFSVIGTSIVYIFNSILSDYTGSLGYGVKVYGLLDAAFGTGSVLMGVFLTIFSQKLHKSTIIPYFFIGMTLALAILSASNSALVSLIGIFVLGASIMGEAVSRKTLQLEAIDKKYIGRVESLNWICISSLAPLISLGGSLLAEFTSSKLTFGVIFIVMLPVVFLSYRVIGTNKKKGYLDDVDISSK